MQSNSYKVKTQKPAHKQETKEQKPKRNKNKAWQREETLKRNM